MKKKLLIFSGVILGIFIILLVYLFFSVKSGIYIRVANTGNYDFGEVTINYLGQIASYGKIPRGGKSAHIRIKRAYDYAYIKAKVANKYYEIKPIDYVGASRLPRGKYTYILEFNPKEKDSPLLQTISPSDIKLTDRLGIRLNEIIYENFLGNYDW